MESALRDASVIELRTVDEFIGDADPENGMEIIGGGWSLREASQAVEVLNDVTALLSADSPWAWSELDRLVDGLSDEQARLLMEELDPAALPPGVEPSVEGTQGETG